MIKRQDIIAYFDDEILRRCMPREIGDHQPLVHIVGNMRLPVHIGRTARQFLWCGRLFYYTRRAV